MKLKQHPDDFQVEELTDLVAGREGPFAFYRLEKVGWSTHDAFAAIRRRWHINPDRLAFGGLKDRHARTVQFFTIHQGPRRDLEHDRVHVHYIGQIGKPYSSKCFHSNRFRITIRDLTGQDCAAMDDAIERVASCGVPNYFDDQRFGSVSGLGGEWIARLLVEGRFEDALRLALTGAYEHDRAAEKREKQLLRQYWGDWGLLGRLLPRGHTRFLVDHLRKRPGDFKGAVVRLRPELRGLYLSAYQSHLWNRMLARWLEANVPPEHLCPVLLRTGSLAFPDHLSTEVQEKLDMLTLPLPTARWKPASEDPRASLMEEVLRDEGLTLRDLQVRGVRELFFSRGDRAAWCRPANLAHTWENDEMNKGKHRLTLMFDLSRGSYATIVIKAVLHSSRCSRLGRSRTPDA